MLRKVSSDWLPSFVKATRPVLEILKWLDSFGTDLVQHNRMAGIKKSISLLMTGIKQLPKHWFLTQH
jgi:hypothetical protein